MSWTHYANNQTPAIDPGEGRSIRGEVTTLLWGDNHLVTVTVDGKMPFGWRAGMRAEVAVWPRGDAPPLTVTDIHRAAITRHLSPDCCPDMRYSVNLPDGTRGHAPTYEGACRLFDDCVRRVLSTRGGGA